MTFVFKGFWERMLLGCFFVFFCLKVLVCDKWILMVLVFLLDGFQNMVWNSLFRVFKSGGLAAVLAIQSFWFNNTQTHL